MLHFFWCTLYVFFTFSEDIISNAVGTEKAKNGVKYYKMCDICIICFHLVKLHWAPLAEEKGTPCLDAGCCLPYPPTK